MDQSGQQLQTDVGFGTIPIPKSRNSSDDVGLDQPRLDDAYYGKVSRRPRVMEQRAKWTTGSYSLIDISRAI